MPTDKQQTTRKLVVSLVALALLFFVTAVPINGVGGAFFETVVFVVVFGGLGLGLRNYFRRRDRSA